MAPSRPETLELHEPEGAFRSVEDWLRGRGFFEPGGESLQADLYLGYGLSQAIRRTSTPPPPEPCALPLAACRLVHDGTRRGASVPRPVAIGEWEPTWSDGDYADAVEEVRDAIAFGDVYQVNLVQHLSAACAAEHVMIVDLERNHLSRVCKPGTGPLARAHGYARADRHPPRGRRPRRPARRDLPRGSVTGAPKIAAADLIAGLEPVGRGASMGALGRVHGNGDFDLALTIRTFAVAGRRAHLWVGGGVVWDSAGVAG